MYFVLSSSEAIRDTSCHGIRPAGKLSPSYQSLRSSADVSEPFNAFNPASFFCAEQHGTRHEFYLCGGALLTQSNRLHDRASVEYYTSPTM